VVFAGNIECRPEPDEGRLSTPVVNVQVIEDLWATNLVPDGLALLAAKLRDQADRLDHEIRPAFVAARADWTAHRTS
jgi:hypothetical protein